MKRLISVTIIALLVMLSIDILGISFANSTIPNSITAQTAFAEEMALAPNEAITKAATLTKVTISPNKFTLAPGKTRQLNLILTPSNASLLSKTKWESDNEGIATVDKNGKVTAIKEGIVSIRFMTWSKAGLDDPVEASTICFVSNKAPKAAALTKKDFQLTIDGKKVDFSNTYNQIKKLFPGGKEENVGPDIMAYNTNGKEDYDGISYAYSFTFNKKGTSNRKVLDIKCYYYANDISVKTYRGIKLGSSSIINVVNAYGYPNHCYSDSLGRGDVLYDKKIGKDTYTMWMCEASPYYDDFPGSGILMIGMRINDLIYYGSD